MITRRKTRQIRMGNVKIGGDAPLTVQSMTKTDTRDVQATLLEIWALEAAGCDVVRCAVPVREAAERLGEIKRQIRIPLVADIHFNYKLALIALEQGVYPFHLGVTEAGTPGVGTIKSAVGLGALLSEGIGDTIRVSLSADPTEEVRVGIDILKSLGLRKGGLTFVSCPSCGRADVDLVKLAKQVEDEFKGLNEEIHIAVMGCVPEGEHVITRQGPKTIERVSETDEVLTHAGEYRKVEWASTVAFDGELVEIQPTGFVPVRLTENHPVWAFPRPMRLKAGRERRPHVQAVLTAGAEPRWVPAGQLRAGWVLAYPV